MTQPSEYKRFAKLDFQPPPEPEPAKILVRNNEGFPKLVLPEDDAWELYCLLHKHFERRFGDTDAKEQAD